MNLSGYSRRGNNPRQFYSPHASLSSPDSAHSYGPPREMGPPPPVDFPPQPVEIDSSRTLPSPAASSAAWDPSFFQGPGMGEILYGVPSIPKMQQPLTGNQSRTGQQNPLVQWYVENDGPWVPKVIPVVPEQRNMRRSTGSSMMAFGTQYRQANQSDGGSYPEAVTHSDSGYGTRRSIENTSVYSAEVLEQDQDCHSLIGQVADFQPFGLGEVLPPRDLRPQDQWALPVPNSTATGSQHLQCPTCFKFVKTPSELRKHDQRHSKPFVCRVNGCQRIEGFSTSNDLDRHMNSKHPKLKASSKATKRYRCCVPGCKSQEKSWPRLDNFRSHLKRVHPNYFATTEEFEDMARRAVYWETNGAVMDQDSLFQRRPSLPSLSQATGPILQGNMARRRTITSGFLQISPEIRNPTLGGLKANIPELEQSAARMMLGSEAAGGLPKMARTDAAQPMDPSCDLPRLKKMTLDSASSTPVGLSDVIEKNDGPSSPKSLDFAAAGEAAMQTNVSATQATVADAIRSIFAGANMPELGKDCKSDQGAGRNAPPKMRASSGGDCLAEPSSAASATGRPGDPIDLGNSPTQASETGNSEAARSALEIIKVLRDLGYTVHKDSGHSPKAQSPGSAAPKKAENKFACEQSDCEVTVARLSELKKHMRRHERPWGCTFTNCNKDFGSKNDWKRHENSQHHQIETWRCNLAKTEGGACTKVSYRRQTFQEHLKRDHEMKDEDAIKLKAESCRIGKHCDARFWCGFCATLVELKGTGLDAWIERFNHIDDHFRGRRELKEQRIQEWVPVDSDKPRGDIETSPRHADSPEKDSPDEDSPESAPSHAPSPDESSPESVAPGASPEQPLVVEDGDRALGKRKREISSEVEENEHEEETQRPMKQCQCDMSYNARIVTNCSNCESEHRFCGDCRHEAADEQ